MQPTVTSLTGTVGLSSMSETRSPEQCPATLRRGLYRILLRGQIAYDDERRMGPVMGWIHNEGPRLGYRVPNPEERARATGRAQYFAALGLNEVQLYNVYIILNF